MNPLNYLQPRFRTVSAVLALGSATLQAQALLSIRLPERTRLLEDQRVDLVVEIRNASSLSGFRVLAGNRDITSRFRGPLTVDLDCDGRQDMVYRADLFGFTDTGLVRLTAAVDSSAGMLADVRDITIYPFRLAEKQRNIILFIGDAMGNAYRDAGRIIYRSLETRPGVPGFREGFFDSLMDMDKMPVSGMVMTYAPDRVIPDSANTASAWTTGNKTFDAAMGVFADGNDCAWRGGANAANLSAVLDNPRIETLWEYMRRKHNYRTGVVSTAYITDATPAAHGSHTGSRNTTFDIARQYLENPLLNNQPVFDVILGGGREDFDPDVRADRRDLVAEFVAKGYHLVSTAAELRPVDAGATRLLGLFRRPATVSTHSSGVRASGNGNMQPAYDKLGLRRPGSEPVASFGIWTDQPFLDLMTRKAIEVLSGRYGDQPFLLMVEGALIDKQSHPNHAAGTLWDVIELDKAVGVARGWAKARPSDDTLIIVTADHDQSLTIIGVVDVSDTSLTDRSLVWTLSASAPVGSQTARVQRDINTNVRAAYNYNASGGDPNTSGREGPPADVHANMYGTSGFPDYVDSDGDGWPDNRESGGKGRKRLAVGFRTGNHTGTSVPLTAEGPGAFLFTGYMDQTDIMFKMAVALSGDTADGDAFVRNVLLSPRYPQTVGK